MTNEEMYDMYSNNSFNNDLSPKPWEKRYALFPRDVNGTLVWLDYYYRRMVWSDYNAGDDMQPYPYHEWRQEYGTILDVLKA